MTATAPGRKNAGRMDRRAAFGLLAAGFGGLGVAGHALSAGHGHHAESAAANPLTLLAVAAALTTALALLRPSGRRALAVTLVAVLSVLGFETALHSVHHLDEPDSGASCPVLTASSQLSGVAAPVADLSVHEDTSGLVIALDRAWLLPSCALRVPEGRAPPAPPSA